MAPEAALGALAQAVTARGAHVTTQSASTLTGTITVRRQPNVIVAVVLFLLCIVPMIIYLIVQSRPDVYGWSIHVAPEGEGSLVTYSASPAPLRRSSPPSRHSHDATTPPAPKP